MRTIFARSTARSIALWVTLSVALWGCPSTTTAPLPAGPPPEYETPRGYEPDTNIDSIDEGGAPLEAPPPAAEVPPADVPPDGPAQGGAGGADGAGGGAGGGAS